MYKLEIHRKGPKKSPLRDIDISLSIDRTHLAFCQNGALMLWTTLCYKIVFYCLICKVCSVILNLIVTREYKKAYVRKLLKYKKAFFVFCIDFYFGVCGFLAIG